MTIRTPAARQMERAQVCMHQSGSRRCTSSLPKRRPIAAVGARRIVITATVMPVKRVRIRWKREGRLQVRRTMDLEWRSGRGEQS